MDPIKEFENDVRREIDGMGEDIDIQALSRVWVREISPHKYSYHFSWMGRPIIQFPQDVMALQEIIWSVKPDLIVETGVAHGGSLIFTASMLELLGGKGQVLGIDIDIRAHNRKEIESHPMSRRIQLLQGSSIDPNVMAQVKKVAEAKERVLVILDSNHTHDHVLEELRLYSPLVKKGSYLVVLDTIIEDMPPGFFPNRPWKKGNSPKTAVWKFLEENDRFAVDATLHNKLLITSAPDGFLKCTK